MSVQHLKRIQPTVEKLLEQRPELRESDIDLILAVWQFQGVHLSGQQIEDIRKAAHPESVRRVRAKLHSEGKYLPTKEKVEQRALFAEEHRQYHRNNPYA